MSESTIQKQLAAMQKKINSLEKKLAAFESQTPRKKEKVKREPSAYNKFMSSEGTKIKNERPDLDQPSVMREVAKRWNAQKK